MRNNESFMHSWNANNPSALPIGGIRRVPQAPLIGLLRLVEFDGDFFAESQRGQGAGLRGVEWRLFASSPDKE